MYKFHSPEAMFDGLESLGDLGALAAYPAVGKLQKFINAVGERAGLAPIGQDNKYGEVTHEQFKLVLRWLRQNGYPATPFETGLDTSGPILYGAVLLGTPPYQPFTIAEITVLQKAWSEWKTASGPVSTNIDQEVDATDDTPGEPTATVVPLTTEETIVPGAKRAGLGLVGWSLIGAGVLAAGYGGYRWYQSRQRAPRFAPRYASRRY